MPVHYGSKRLNHQTISSPLATQLPQVRDADLCLLSIITSAFTSHAPHGAVFQRPSEQRMATSSRMRIASPCATSAKALRVKATSTQR